MSALLLSSNFKQKYQTCLQGKHQYHHWLPNENFLFPKNLPFIDLI